MVRAANYHLSLFVYESFLAEITKAKLSPPVHARLLSLARIFALKSLVDEARVLYFQGYFEGHEEKLLRAALKV